MIDENKKREIIDAEHLRLLSLFHYIFGGILLASSLFIVVYVIFIYAVLGQFLESGSFERFTYANTPDEAVFRIIMIIVIVALVFVVLMGVFQILSGRFIKSRKYRTFSYVIAILNLFSIPYGSILGIMTLMVLGKNSVKELYNKNQFTSLADVNLSQ